jgi:PKD repeat protein
VTRNGNTTLAASVTCATANGAAGNGGTGGTAGVNYTASSQLLSWAAGVGGTKSCNTASLNAGDGSITNYNVNLQAPITNATLGSPAQKVVQVTASGSTGSGAAFTPSRTSCLVPCFVYFDATASNSDGDGTSGEWFDDLVNATFDWDFAESGEASNPWAYGARATGASTLDHDHDKGFVAAHIFKTAATYAVALTVTNSAGATSVVTHNVVVSAWTNDNGGVGNSPTYCFSTGATFTGCPASSTQVTQSNFTTAVNQCTNNGARQARCIFKGGDTFTSSGAILVKDGDDTTGGSIIAGGNFYGFGSGRAIVSGPDAPPPLTGESVFGIQWTNGAGPGANTSKTHMLIWDDEVSCTGCGTAFGLDRGDYNGLIDNYIHDMFSYGWGDAIHKNGAFMGNFIEKIGQRDTNNSHIYRNASPIKLVFSHNKLKMDPVTLGGTQAVKSYAKFQASDATLPTPIKTQYTWIYDNWLVQNSQNNSGAGIEIGLQFCCINEPVGQIAVDSNLVTSLLTPAPTPPGIYVQNCDSCVMRNNTLQTGDNGSGAISVVSYTAAGAPPASDQNQIIGNTAWNSAHGVNGCTISAFNVGVPGGQNPAATTNTVIRDSLYYVAPGATCGSNAAGQCGGTGCTADHNTLIQNGGAIPFTGASPTTVDAFKLNADQTGLATTGLRQDVFGVNRANPPDVGAAEFQGIPGTNISIVPHITSCTAPCAVYFDATQTDTNGNGTPGEWLNDIAAADFKWNFGDSTAATKSWPHGARVAGAITKNVDWGFITAHIFETAGTYTVTLTVTRASDGAQGSKTQTITVNAWSDGAGATPTYCYSTSGTFTGCPAGGNQVTVPTGGVTDYTTAVNQCTSTGARVARCLFRGGEHFGGNSNPSAKAVTSGQGTIIAGGGYLYGFGTGHAILDGTANLGAVAGSSWFDFIGANNAGPGSDTSSHNILVWKNDLACSTCGTGLGGDRAKYNFLMENDLHDFGIFCWGDNIEQFGAWMGNSCIRANRVTNFPGGHDYRNAAPTNMVISHNYHQIDADGNGNLNNGIDGWKLNGLDAINDPGGDYNCTANPAGQPGCGIPTQYVWFFDNECAVAGQNSTSCVEYGPQFAATNEPMRWGIFDSNFFHRTGGFTGNITGMDMANCDSCVFRNNAIELTNNGNGGLNAGAYKTNVSPPISSNLQIYGNTCWNPGGATCTIACLNIDRLNQQAATNSVVRDNMSFQATPDGLGHSCGVVAICPTCGVQDHNLALLNTAQNPFVSSAITTQADFKLKSCVVGGATCPIQAGVASPYLWLDGFGDVRGLAQPDIGAHDFGAPPD